MVANSLAKERSEGRPRGKGETERKREERGRVEGAAGVIPVGRPARARPI